MNLGLLSPLIGSTIVLDKGWNAYLGGDEELGDGETTGCNLHGLAFTDDCSPRPIAISARIGHAGGYLLSQPDEYMAAIV